MNPTANQGWSRQPEGDKYIFTYKRTVVGVNSMPKTCEYRWETRAHSLEQAYGTFEICHEPGTYISHIVVEKQTVVVFEG